MVGQCGEGRIATTMSGHHGLNPMLEFTLEKWTVTGRQLRNTTGQSFRLQRCY